MSIWLSDSDINRAMSKFKIKGFEFIGAYPCDYFMYHPYLELKGKMGIILNTENLCSSGVHWVALYITSRRIIYFDPLGNPPNRCISKFINDIIKNRKLIINNTVYQKKNGDCGLYCIEFLKCMVLRRKLKYFL